jgi:SsrA-binding protein
MSNLAGNKKARFDYEILDTYEAGLVLTGQEVKSVRQGQANLKGAYVSINHQGEVCLTNATIPKYKMAGPLPDYDSTRSRKLLLHKKEIDSLQKKLQQAGLTLVALSLYTKRNKIKLEIGLAKGKKKADKRQTIKDREQKRELGRTMKQKFQ